ncbi:hypothetical protein [Agromyces bauzanensis]
MDKAIDRAPEPTTPVPGPDAAAPEPAPAPEFDPGIRDRVRDVLPPVEYDGTVLSDPDAAPRSVDPLDPHFPSRETGDPLDPDGHVR